MSCSYMKATQDVYLPPDSLEEHALKFLREHVELYHLHHSSTRTVLKRKHPCGDAGECTLTELTL